MCYKDLVVSPSNLNLLVLKHLNLYSFIQFHFWQIQYAYAYDISIAHPNLQSLTIAHSNLMFDRYYQSFISERNNEH